VALSIRNPQSEQIAADGIALNDTDTAPWDARSWQTIPSTTLTAVPRLSRTLCPDRGHLSAARPEIASDLDLAAGRATSVTLGLKNSFLQEY